MNQKTRLFSIIFITAIMSVVAILFIDSYSFLPKTVLQIDELPRSAEIIESGSNASIGTQLFINQWMLRISSEHLPMILSGRNYSSCSEGFKNGKKIANTLQLHNDFIYSNCYEYEEDSSDIRLLTRIYANSTNTMLLVEYQTE